MAADHLQGGFDLHIRLQGREIGAQMARDRFVLVLFGQRKGQESSLLAGKRGLFRNKTNVSDCYSSFIHLERDQLGAMAIVALLCPESARDEAQAKTGKAVARFARNHGTRSSLI
jgi:hypothetical protein